MKKKKKKSIKYRRTSEVKLTNEARILRMIREERSISIREVAKDLGYSETYIRHIEKGRLDVPEGDLLRKLLSHYDVTFRQFKKRTRGNVMIDKKEECIALIYKLDKKNLDIVWGILKQFT
jgi:transcriptional regulator with XRE-family HTH domain